MRDVISSGWIKMKKNRPTRVSNKPRGWIYGAKWAGIPVDARVVLATVGLSPKGWWCEPYMGTRRQAIEVMRNGDTTYIDNEGGKALAVFLRGAAPRPGFRFLPILIAQDDPSSELFYKAEFYGPDTTADYGRDKEQAVGGVSGDSKR
jgi:hypothetical protein